MAGNVPAISINSFDFDKSYGAVYLQEGVPIMDSDWNESVDNIWVRGIQLSNKALFGNVRLAHYASDGTASSDSGFKLLAVGTANNFALSDGYACCHGVLVASTDSSPPSGIVYADQVVSTGTVTGVGGGQMIDTSKNWDSGHQLVGCLVTVAGIGTPFVIASVDSATTVTLSGGTGAIAPTDTYTISPPVLTTPSGSDRTDLAYLMVFFEDQSVEEDAAIAHPDTGLEAVHKTRIRSVVRVLEGSTTLPTTASTITDGYGVRYMTLGTISRSDGVAAISVVTPEENFRDNLENLSSTSILHDTTAITALGYSLTAGVTTMGGVLDDVLTILAGDTTPAGSSHIGQKAVAGTPSSITVGTAESAAAELLGFINARILDTHPTVSVTSPVLLWRSGNITADVDVTKDTLSIYLLPPNVLTTSASVRIAYCTGFYLDGALAYAATAGTPAAMATMTILGDEIQFLSKNSLTANWVWASAGSWQSGMYYAPDGPSSDGALNILDPVTFGSRVALNTESYLQLTDLRRATLQPLFQTYAPSGFLVTTSGGIYSDGVEIWITSNVNWDAPTSTWNIANTDYSGHAVLFGSPHASMISYHMPKGATNHLLGWSRYVWAAQQTIGASADTEMGADTGYVYAGSYSLGNTYEKLHFSGYVRQTVPSANYTLGPVMLDSCNLRTRRSSITGAYHVTFLATYDQTAHAGVKNTTASIIDSDEWGCTLLMQGSQGLGGTDYFLSDTIYGGAGYVEVYS